MDTRSIMRISVKFLMVLIPLVVNFIVHNALHEAILDLFIQIGGSFLIYRKIKDYTLGFIQATLVKIIHK